MNWIEPYINEYISFIKKNTLVNENTGTDWVSISTPMVDMHNDAIELYAKKQGEKIVLSDDGYTLNNLKNYGIEFNRSGKKKDLLEQILLTYGIKLLKEELYVEATNKNFPQQKLNLLQAITEVNDLHVLSSAIVSTIFAEEVEEFLKSKRVIYTPHFIARGSSGLEFTFDFQLATFEKEILLKAFGSTTQNSVVNFLYGWNDVQDARAKQSKKQIEGIAIIKDTEKKPKNNLIEALESKGAKVLLWSEKESDKAMSMLQ